MKEDIDPKNTKGQWHGYQEWHFSDYWVRCNYVNGNIVGYYELNCSEIKSESICSFGIR